MALNRRKEREVVFKMLFASQFSSEESDESLFETFINEFDEENIAESKYIKDVFFGARKFIPQALELIGGAAMGWKVERLSKVTLTILELALFEIKNYAEEVPEKISINEAVELAKLYDNDKAPKFINGVLGKIVRCEETDE